jgi:hypothetical protein
VDTSPVIAGFAVPFARATTSAHTNARRAQVATHGLAPDAGRALNAQKRPSEPPQRADLLSFLFAQDIPHAAKDHGVPADVNVSGVVS